MNKERSIIAILVVMLVALGGVFLARTTNKTDVTKVDVTAPVVASVATVNGVAIPKTVFEAQLASAITTLKSQGVDVADPAKLSQLKTQVLGDLINNELVAQGITKAGVATSPADIEKQFQAILTQVGGADKLKTQLTAANLTEEQLRANITRQLTVQAYLLQNINTKSITVSDAEIAKVYADGIKGQKNVPKLKEVSAQIKQQLTTSKEQALVATFLTSLRQQAKITTSI